jgi:hypothetical protein
MCCCIAIAIKGRVVGGRFESNLWGQVLQFSVLGKNRYRARLVARKSRYNSLFFFGKNGVAPVFPAVSRPSLFLSDVWRLWAAMARDIAAALMI